MFDFNFCFILYLSQKLDENFSSATVQASSSSSDSNRFEQNSEAVEAVMQNANVSRPEAVLALLENYIEPLTAVIVRPNDKLKYCRLYRLQNACVLTLL